MGKYAKTIFKQSIACQVIFTYFRSAKLNVVTSPSMKLLITFMLWQIEMLQFKLKCQINRYI